MSINAVPATADSIGRRLRPFCMLASAAAVVVSAVELSAAQVRQNGSFNQGIPQLWWVCGVVILLIVIAGGLLDRSRLSALAARERALRREVARQSEARARLSQLTAVVNEAVALEDVLDHIYDNLHSIVPYDRIGVALIDDDRLALRAVWSRGKSAELGIARGYEAALKGSSLAEMLETGRPRIITDLELYLRQHPDSDSTRRIVHEGIRSSLTCPLRAMGNPLGFIFFSSFRPHAYDESHIDFLQQIAGQLALIIAKSKLYDDLLATKARLEEANRRLERLASADGLTGLANRRGFDNALETHWRNAAAAGEPLSLIMLDVDHFKALNDALGHAAGDRTLQSIALTIVGCTVGVPAVPVRYGGEEFAVILPGCDSATAVATAETLRRTIERTRTPHPASPVAPFVTISIGAATIRPDASNRATTLVEQADRALYEAKRTGRNRVVSTPLSQSDDGDVEVPPQPV